MPRKKQQQRRRPYSPRETLQRLKVRRARIAAETDLLRLQVERAGADGHRLPGWATPDAFRIVRRVEEVRKEIEEEERQRAQAGHLRAPHPASA